MKKYLTVFLILLFVSCRGTKKIISVKKKTAGFVLKEEKIAITPPILNNSSSDRLHDFMNKIGKAVLPKSFVITPEIKINDYNNKKIIILKTARSVAADFVIYTKIEYSTIQYYPERNKFPDHVNLESVDKNQIQYGERMSISLELQLFNAKNYFEVIERNYSYSFFAMPFEDSKKEQRWIKGRINISLREGFKNFLNEIGGREIKTPRMIFLK